MCDDLAPCCILNDILTAPKEYKPRALRAAVHLSPILAHWHSGVSCRRNRHTSNYLIIIRKENGFACLEQCVIKWLIQLANA